VGSIIGIDALLEGSAPPPLHPIKTIIKIKNM